MEVGEVLSALGAVPSGFRVSELHKLEKEFDLKSTLVANIDKNATIFYSNLTIDPLTNKVQTFILPYDKLSVILQKLSYKLTIYLVKKTCFITI